jgi:hypothetical protein
MRRYDNRYTIKGQPTIDRLVYFELPLRVAPQQFEIEHLIIGDDW